MSPVLKSQQRGSGHPLVRCPHLLQAACSGHVSLSTAPLLRAHGGGEHSENNGLLIDKITGSLPIGNKTIGHILGYTDAGEQTTRRSPIWGDRRAVFSENRFSSDFCLVSPSF